MSLKGGRELRARLKALKTAFKPLGRDWADDYVKLARPQIPVKTGKTRQSLRRRNASQRKATVVGSQVAYFIDAGAKAHVIRPKRGGGLIFEAGGRTIFAKKVNHPGHRARPFRKRVALEALRRNPLADAVVKSWNEAAK
jgi:hypothetical protein